MRRYTAYKDSGTAWLGEVPAHWAIGRLKDFVVANPTFKIPDSFSDETSVEFVPMTNVNEEVGVIRKFDMAPLAEVTSGYRRFQNGDVIFAKITPCMENGNCAVVSGLSRNIGFGSTEFLVYRPKRCLNSRFLHYFLYNDLFRKNAVPFMKGSAGQKRLPNDYVETHAFPLPPLPEQQAIADYLDAKTAQIDRKIDLLTQKAAKYRQLKQSIINAAVTRGLDKSAPMKDSGVEWIGEVPAHWTVCRVKDELRSLDHKRAPLSGEVRQEMATPQYDYYGASGVIDRVDDFIFDEPLILIGEDGANLLLRNSALAFVARGKYWVNNHAHVLKPYRGDLHYFCYLLESMDYTTLVSGSAQPKLTAGALANIVLVVPSVSEQLAIATYLDDKATQIDGIVETIDTQIDKLKDLCKALINDVVTGKLRVT